jgi:histidine ammonia-lyase
MGSNAATKLWKVVQNTERVLAIELMNSAQALEFRRQMTSLRSSESVEAMFEAYRKVVPFVDNDTVMYPHIATSVKFLNDYELAR